MQALPISNLAAVFAPFIKKTMNKQLSRYLIIYTIAQLFVFIIAAIYPFFQSSVNMSPRFHIACRTLLDCIPGIVLAGFLFYDMSHTGRVKQFPLILTLFGGMTGLLMHLSQLPIVRKYGAITIIYSLLLIVFSIFFPYLLNALKYILYATVLVSVLYDLWYIHLPQCSQTYWLQAIIFILSFTHPWTAILSIFILSLPAALPAERIKPLLRYLIPIVIFTFANKICTAIPGNISLFGIPASVTIPTILSLILFCIIVVMLYRDAPRTRLPRLWLCASAIGSAPVAAMCCLFAQQEQDGASSVENNNPDNNLQTS